MSAANTIIPFHFPTSTPGLLPVRVRGHHAPAVPGERARAHQVHAPGACSSRCGRPSSTASTPSCSGAAATSPRRARSTSPVASSSTCRPVCPASSRPGSSDRGSCEIDSTPCPTTWSWRRSVPASCGSAGTASTVVTRTTPGPSMAAAVVNTNLATGDRRPRLDGHGRLAHQGEEADLPRRRERHDLRPGRHHAVRRLGQRPGRHLRRRHLHGRRLGVPGTTCPRCGRSRRSTTPSVSSTPTASPASSAACCSASSATRT